MVQNDPPIFILGSSEMNSLTRTGDSFKMVTKTGKSIEFRERPLLTSDCRVGRVVQNDPPIFILGSSEMNSLTRTGDSFKMVTKPGKSIEFRDRSLKTSDCKVGWSKMTPPPKNQVK